MTDDYTIYVVLTKNGQPVERRVAVEWVAPANTAAHQTAYAALVSTHKLVASRYELTDPEGRDR